MRSNEQAKAGPPGVQLAEVAVIGAGVVGLAVADALNQSGVDVCCFEQGRPGGGQSAGLTRVFRHCHDDGGLIRLAAESRERWRDWERRAGRRLLGQEGVLWLQPELDELASELGRSGIEHRVLDPGEQEQVLPIRRGGTDRAVLDVPGGAIRAARTVETLAGWLGPRLVRSEVFGVHPNGNGVLVATSEGLWRCQRALICAGTRTPELAASLDVRVPGDTVCHLRATFRVRPHYAGTRLPAYVDLVGGLGELVYGGPVGSSGRYVLGLAGPEDDEPVPAATSSMPARADLTAAAARLEAYVSRAFPGLDPEPVAHRVCVSTALPGPPDAFALWQAGPIAIIAGTNLFKFAPVLGRLLGETLATGRIAPELAFAAATIDA